MPVYSFVTRLFSLERARRGSLAALLLFGFAIRAVFALRDDGIYWPDEIYQSLEPGHRLAFGYGLLPWEFIDGARPWVLPALVAALLKTLSGLGLSSPQSYLPAIELILCAVSSATAYGCYRLVRALGGGHPAGLFAAALFSLGSLSIYFAPRFLSETVSALPVVLGFALALPASATLRRRAFGALLLACAVWLRLQNGLFCAVLLGVWAARREWRPLLWGAGIMAAAALALGGLDRLTWGDWFHSAKLYLRFNLIEGKASAWGTSPPSYYVRRLLSAMPTVTPLLLILPFFAIRRATGLWVAAAASFALHSWVPHKELRFILPVLPLLGALAALGGESLLRRDTTSDRRWSRLAASTGFALCLASAILFPRLTFGDLGQYGQERRLDSAFDDGGPTHRLLLRAHRQGDLCGLKIETRKLAWTGGSSALHRPVPLYPPDGPARDSGHFNYIIAHRSRAPGQGREMALQGSEGLYKIRQDCLPDPGYSWRLP